MSEETRVFYERLLVELELNGTLTEFLLDKYLDEFFPREVPDRNGVIQLHTDQS